MKGTISVSATRYGTLSLGVWLGGVGLYLSSRNRREILIHLLNRARWRIARKDAQEMRWESDVPEKLAVVIRTIQRMKRVTREDVVRWRGMSTDELYEEVLPLSVAQNL